MFIGTSKIYSTYFVETCFLYIINVFNWKQFYAVIKIIFNIVLFIIATQV